MIEARIDVVRSAKFSCVKIAGPQSFKVAATFRLMSVTTDLRFKRVSFSILILLQRIVVICEIRK
jgi:hypothetical protein